MREAFRKDAVENGWLWVGSDISGGPIREESFVLCLFAGLNSYAGGWECTADEWNSAGFAAATERKPAPFDGQTMMRLFKHEPGLISDKIKRVLLVAWELMKKHMPQKKGIVFAWDDAHNLAGRSVDTPYPLGWLIDAFHSLQSQGAPFMLVLSGLPTLFPKLLESRTYTERMFREMPLGNLSAADSRIAITKPLDEELLMKTLFKPISKMIYEFTKGHPRYIQICSWEVYDYLHSTNQLDLESVFGAIQQIMKRIFQKVCLDVCKDVPGELTDQQRDLLRVIARLENSGAEFTAQEIVNASKGSGDAFGGSHANQMLTSLYEKGMVFKTRHGKYVLAVPLLAEYIRRRMDKEKVRTT
ncbi:MAG: ATP-binding protein [Gammaproteobacteria bacterium]